MSFSKIACFCVFWVPPPSCSCCSIPSKLRTLLNGFSLRHGSRMVGCRYRKGPQGGAGLVCASPAPPSLRGASAMPGWTTALRREQDKVLILSFGWMSCTLSVSCALYALPILGYCCKGSAVVLLLGPASYSDGTCALQEFVCGRLHCWWSGRFWYWSTSLG